MKSRDSYLNIFQQTVKMFHNIAVIARSVADKALGMIPVQVLLFLLLAVLQLMLHSSIIRLPPTLQSLYADIGVNYKKFTQTFVEIFSG